MDHSKAPILEALAAYHADEYLSFTPPGHKQGRGVDPRVLAVLGEDVFRVDVPAVGGLDDRTSSRGVLKAAEELMADAVGADHAFFSTCGSSLSVKAAMLSVAGPDQELLIGRDAHESVVSGLILSGVRPVWVEPRWDPELHLAHPPSPEAFEAAFAEHPDAAGALITSPTPYGGCADLAAVAEVCHDRDKPLIVDEAWGAHLPFHPDLPRSAMEAEADVCVTSAHKMGAGLEQGSVFQLRGDRVPPELLASRADLLGTASPSVAVYAALDGWRRRMAEHGRGLLDHGLALAALARARIAEIDGMHPHGRDDFREGGAADLDPLHVVVDVSELRVTGYSVADRLRARHRVDLDVADHRRAGAQLTHADDERTVERLLRALADTAAHADDLRPAVIVEVPDPALLRLEQGMPPRDAFFARTERVPWRRASGRIAAETLTPSPPGIPVALPGERLTDDVLRYLRTGVNAGMCVADAADSGVHSVRVVIED